MCPSGACRDRCRGRAQGQNLLQTGNRDQFSDRKEVEVEQVVEVDEQSERESVLSRRSLVAQGTTCAAEGLGTFPTLRFLCRPCLTASHNTDNATGQRSSVQSCLTRKRLSSLRSPRYPSPSLSRAYFQNRPSLSFIVEDK
jgi:hypothetical protein